jgi:S-disulfanyl-L-cysteine oxidoreductase SoxD
MKGRIFKAIKVIWGAISLLVALAISFLLVRGLKASPPGKLETRVAQWTKHRLVGGTNAKNPLPPTAANIALGQQNFSHYCFACHGLDAQNTGVPFADAMSPPVPSLASSGVQAYSDGQLHWIIANGLWPSGMPASRGILDDEEVWSIVLYVRHLPSEGSLGEPAMYSGDSASPSAESGVR